MALVRGAGSRGLGGIPPRRENIIRPLLGTSREEIEEYLKQNDIPYIDDSSNFSDAYTRNRFRRRLLPILSEENAGALRHIVQAAATLREDEECLSNLAADFIKRQGASLRSQSGSDEDSALSDEEIAILPNSGESSLSAEKYVKLANYKDKSHFADDFIKLCNSDDGALSNEEFAKFPNSGDGNSLLSAEKNVKLPHEGDRNGSLSAEELVKLTSSGNGNGLLIAENSVEFPNNGDISLSIEALLKLPKAVRVRVYRQMCPRTPELKHIQSIEALCIGKNVHGGINLPGVYVSREYDRLFFQGDSRNNSNRKYYCNCKNNCDSQNNCDIQNKNNSNKNNNNNSNNNKNNCDSQNNSNSQNDCDIENKFGRKNQAGKARPTSGNVPDALPEITLEFPSAILLDNFGWEIRCEKTICPKGIYKSFNTFYFQSEKIYGRITVGARRGGAKLRIAGRNCEKSLKKLFREARVPLSERERIPVLYDERGAVAVYGFGIGEGLSAEPGRECLKVEIRKI